MNKILKRVIRFSVLALLVVWIFMCQFMMQDRVPDSYLKKKFSDKGLTLYTGIKKISGHDLHYAKTGNDTNSTLIFIHGTPGSLSNFQRYLQDSDLFNKYRVISIDRPGFGYSDFGNTMDLEHQANLIAGLLDSLSNNKPFYLMGHSLAGPLIIKIASIKPSTINGLIVLAGSVDPAQEGSRWWRPIITYSPIRWLVPREWRYSNEEQYWLKDDLEKIKDDFPKVICPVYIFHGDKDVLVPLSNADYTRRMLTNSSKVETKILPGENHFIVWTEYEE